MLNGKLEWEARNSDLTLKLRLGPKELCKGRALFLLKFAIEVFTMNFETKPDYEKLKFLLKQAYLSTKVKYN
jgi:hypothetical protein